MIRWLKISLIVAGMTSVDLSAQSPFLFHQFYPDDGLSNSRITTITQDYLGFIWIGTSDGLNRYDGHEFKVYRNVPGDTTSIDGNIIEKVFEDSQKRLWIGTSEGLSLYDRRKDEFVKFTPVGTVGTSIRAIYEDDDGKIWAGGTEGLQMVDNNEKRLQLFFHGYSSNENQTAVTDILRGADGKLWVATPVGVHSYDTAQRQFINYGVTNNVHVNALLETTDGSIYAGTRRGLFRMATNTNKLDQPVPLPVSLEVIDIHQYKEFLWIATIDGFFQYDLKTGTLSCIKKSDHHFSISDNMVRSILRDRDGNLWLGTFNGLNLVDRSSKFFQASKSNSGLHNDYILSTYVDEEQHVWTGTGDGIEILNIKSSDEIDIITKQYPGLDQVTGAILSITSDDNNTIWFSAWPGFIYNYDTKLRQLSRYREPLPFSLPLLAIRKQGGVWVGTEKGLYILNDISQPLESVELLSKHVVNYVHEDDFGVWIGYQLGLIRFDPLSDDVHYYKKATPPSQLNANTINCMYRDADHVMWIGTEHGLHARKIDGTFESFWMKHGFPDHSVMSIEEDEHHNLWLAANDGLYRFNKTTHRVKTFDRHNGIPGKEFLKNSSSSSTGRRLLFGGTKGLVFFDADSLESAIAAPRVVLTDLKIMNREASPVGSVTDGHISVAPRITLDYTDQEFSIGFVAMSFSEPEKTTYAYKLEGFDHEWNYIGSRRFASYTNLETGIEYTFRVKASNTDGIWSNEETSVKIYIRPPFWQTWWFRTLLYVSIGLVIYLIYRIRVRVIRTHRIELRRQVRKQTAELKLANGQIEKWNTVLKDHNRKLQDDVRNLNVARVLVKPMSFDEFREVYPDENACYKFVEELKWKNGFHCPKCESTVFARGAVPFSRRCVKCNHVDRVTTGTIFSRLKFPITKAFYLLFLVTGNSNLTLRELSEMISLRQQTCWIFRCKVEGIIRKNGGIKNLREGWKSIILTDDEEQTTPRRRSLQRL